MIFSCSHTRYTFPQTSVVRDASGKIIGRRGMFVTCQDCAERLSYDWEKMKVVSGRQHRRASEQRLKSYWSHGGYQTENEARKR
jgi:hypothetical protein